jgi:hypothetical protein
MKTINFFSTTFIFCLNLVFVGCNSHTQKQDFNRADADSTYSKANAERDSVEEGTTVTPTTSIKSNNLIDSLSKVK